MNVKIETVLGACELTVSIEINQHLDTAVFYQLFGDHVRVVECCYIL